MLTFMGLGGTELLFILASLCLLALPIIDLVDVILSQFSGKNDKLIWVIVIVFFSFIGSLLYFFIGRKQRLA